MKQTASKLIVNSVHLKVNEKLLCCVWGSFKRLTICDAIHKPAIQMKLRDGRSHNGNK
jgi:hypothetical protein